MALVLFVAFVVVPLVEIWVILQVGQVIGAWPTVLLLVVDSLLGAWLLRREGLRTWASLRDALAGARMPGRELADAALVLVGGTLLLTPGFVTDVTGFLLILPPTRPLARRALLAVLARRVARGSFGVTLLRPPDAGGATVSRPGSGAGPGGAGDDRVVPGEVVDADRQPTDGPTDGDPRR